MPNPIIKEKQYRVTGLHCASCELLIENKLLAKSNVKSVEVSQTDNSVLIEHTGLAPTIDQLNRWFKQDDYSFAQFDSDLGNKAQPAADATRPWISVNSDGEIIWNFGRLLALAPALMVVALIMIAFTKFSGSGWASLSVNLQSSLLAFVGFGLVAGFSTCSALVGGIVLSMSKQWAGAQRLQSQLLFNLGRLFSYATIGFLLGALGNVFQVSLDFSAWLTIVVSVVMVGLALQMLGIKWANRFQPRLPKILTRHLADQRNFTGMLMPTLLGAGTVFLPCGFTITAQGLALLSGDPVRGALMMTAFALGTAPILLTIGLSSLMFNSRPHHARFFSQVAGFLIIAFATINLNAAFNVLGWPNASSLLIENLSGAQMAKQAAGGEKQIIEMSATAFGYEPEYIKVKVDQPVEWRITDNGASGCTNVVIAKDFFDGQINLVPGQTTTQEFTPTTVGKFRFSCWMGMATGVIEVVP